MALTATTPNNVRVYNVTGKSRSSLPDWVVKRNKRQLKRDPNWSQRVDLIQDFEFPQSCTNLKLTPDQQHIVASGIYKPQIRIFELEEMSLKFERHTSTDTVDFLVLEEDWKKLALLQSDRSIEFHTQFGLHFSTRIPKFGRALAYQPNSCDLLAVGASDEIYRINLEEGMFKKPFQTQLKGINSVAINSVTDLIGVGGEGCCVELWDHRYKKSVASLSVLPHLQERITGLKGVEISQVKFFNNDGITLALGTTKGQVLLYDLRNPFPLHLQDHQYGMPIKSIGLHEQTDNIVSADKKSIRIWDKRTASLYTYVEPAHDINDVLTFPATGLLMAAVEDKQIQTWFIPSLGPAPKWCSFLENVTEELEQNPTPQTWDNFKFVTGDDLKVLALEHLLGGPELKPYMHGYFLNYQVWRKAKLALSLPETLEELRRREQEKQLEKVAKTRISTPIAMNSKLPKINRNLANTILQSTSTKKQQLLNDTRFGQMFEDDDFEIDETSEAYHQRHPSRQPTVGDSEPSDDDIESQPEGVQVVYDSKPSSSDKSLVKHSKSKTGSSSSDQTKVKRRRMLF